MTKTNRFCKVCSSLLDGVEPAEHDHGVGEHEDVAGGQEADVHVEVGQGNVGEAENTWFVTVTVVVFFGNFPFNGAKYQDSVRYNIPPCDRYVELEPLLFILEFLGVGQKLPDELCLPLHGEPVCHLEVHTEQLQVGNSL